MVANKKIISTHKKLQKLYKVVKLIKNKDEKKIISNLFQDLSDKLIDMGFMKLDESKYEYDKNCYCKKCKEYRIANSYGGYSYSNINR